MQTFVPVRSRPAFDSSTTIFVVSLLCICLAEAFMIRGLWFNPATAFHRSRGVDLLFLVWIPAAGTFYLLKRIRNHARDGGISPVLAGNVSTGLSLLLLTASLLITRFAQLAFR